jgi:hypothetical protein
MGPPLIIQEANVAAHKLQDFGRIAATRAMAVNIHKPA